MLFVIIPAATQNVYEISSGTALATFDAQPTPTGLCVDTVFQRLFVVIQPADEDDVSSSITCMTYAGGECSNAPVYA